MENSAAQTVACLLLISHLLYHFRSPLGAATVTDCPRDCVCVNASRHVTCDGVGLTAIPVALLPVTVTSLDLSRNRLAVVDTLRGLGGLVELRLAQNNIRVLRRGTLDHVAASLEVLDLSENNLTKLEPSALSVATHLLHVDLSGNQLNDVDGAFDGLHRLSRLDLRQNRLTAVTSSTFSGLSSLGYLRLDDNRISTVDSRAFVALDRLMYLVLRGNPLGAQFQFHFSSGLLSYVDLSDCGLERFPAGLPASVRYLQLRHNRLVALGGGDLVDVAAELNILVLDENQLEHVDDQAFTTSTNLQQLWLNGNRLRSIPRSLPLTLQRLFIDSNQLASLTVDDFPRPASGAAWQLNTLSAMSNNISFVGSDALASLSRLSSLDLAANRIRKLYPDTFAGNGRLRTLTLSKNPLEVIGARSMQGLDELRTLSLAYIPSTEISLAEDAFGERLPSLRKLDATNSPGLAEALVKSDAALNSLGGVQDLVLLGSELETLSEDFLDVFRSLAVLHLSSTRWRCDASVLWFRNWLLSASIHVEPPRDQIICASPRQVRGHALISLADEDLRPVDGAQRSVRRRRPPPPLVLPTSTSSAEHAATSSPTQWLHRGPPTWEDLSRVHGDISQLDRSHLTTPPLHGNLVAPTTSGLSGLTTGSSTNDRVMLIIAMTVLVTVLAAVVILTVIVHTCRKQPTSQPKKPKETITTTGNGNVTVRAENGYVVGSKTGRHVIYFVANGSRSPKVGGATVEGSKSNTVVEMSDVIDSRHRVTLLPEQNVNDKSSLRVYKWEDF